MSLEQGELIFKFFIMLDDLGLNYGRDRWSIISWGMEDELYYIQIQNGLNGDWAWVSAREPIEGWYDAD